MKTKTLKGGAFIIEDQDLNSFYAPEMLSEEVQQFSEMISDFVEKKVKPNFDKIDKGAHDLVVSLLKEAGELGILSASLPEEYQGLNVDFHTESIISEQVGKAHSFSVALAAHTGIGTLPILYFGNSEQKSKYLPGLGSGALLASYCLTEPGSGSDALGAKTKAVLSEDGKHYILNGQKMWITNAGFADVFIVFAQVDGDKFTGFIVEKGSEGLTLGAEEEKMGIKGSSTRMVFLENVKVPVENLLGEIGKGHKIAFNVLNIGRYKLCVMAMGGAKETFNHAVRYANERIQFKIPIAKFGAIREKIADMAISIYATESATYRTSGLIENQIQELTSNGMDKTSAKLEAAEEYSIECALLKVIGSETLDLVVDESVQIYGGMGFSEESPVARAYRDSRINRIFEGTNEINRLLGVGTLAKRAMKGELDLQSPIKAAMGDLMNMDFSEVSGDLGAEKKSIANAKKAFLIIAGGAIQKFGLEFERQQEIIMKLSDIMIDIFAAESILMRVEKKIQTSGLEGAAHDINILKVFLYEAMDRIYMKGKQAIHSSQEGDQMTMMLMGLKRFTKYESINVVETKRAIAKIYIEKQAY
ncbi:MAG: acyl-CoA dehydrogenase family protein [Chitinophagales bacterium]|nr:acyl-CoA dehydrogenase family protein [Chitinophagales bacterium]